MKATDIKVTSKTVVVNEIYENGSLVGFNTLTYTHSNTHGGRYKYYNLDGSVAYKSQMEHLKTKRVYDRGVWL